MAPRIVYQISGARRLLEHLQAQACTCKSRRCALRASLERSMAEVDQWLALQPPKKPRKARRLPLSGAKP